MPDDAGALTADELDKLNAFLNAQTDDASLTCPVSGQRVSIKDWNAPDRVLNLGGQGGAAFDVLPLTSPSGGVVLLSLLKIGLA